MQSTEHHQWQFFLGEKNGKKTIVSWKVRQAWPVSISETNRFKIQINVVTDLIITINKQQNSNEGLAMHVHSIWSLGWEHFLFSVPHWSPAQNFYSCVSQRVRKLANTNEHPCTLHTIPFSSKTKNLKAWPRSSSKNIQRHGRNSSHLRHQKKERAGMPVKYLNRISFYK